MVVDINSGPSFYHEHKWPAWFVRERSALTREVGSLCLCLSLSVAQSLCLSILPTNPCLSAGNRLHPGGGISKGDKAHVQNAPDPTEAVGGVVPRTPRRHPTQGPGGTGRVCPEARRLKGGREGGREGGGEGERERARVLCVLFNHPRLPALTLHRRVPVTDTRLNMLSASHGERGGRGERKRNEIIRTRVP